MNNNDLLNVSEKLQAYKRKRILKILVSVLSVFVVYFTIHSLILPAITMQQELICDSEEHLHTEDCYKQVSNLICEEKVHEHNEECYSKTTELICTEITIAEDGTVIHEHSDTCYQTIENLICTENTEHTHTDACYQVVDELICGKEEHEHVDACYQAMNSSDPSADVETKEVWESTISSVQLTGNVRNDFVAIAQTQLGYKESDKNYRIEENGDVQGYSRYGQFYNDIYGKWNTYYIGFCLNYANIDHDYFNTDINQFVSNLKNQDQYADKGSYTPIKGDFVFIDFDNNSKIDSIGIIEKVNELNYTILIGDYENQVSRITIDSNNIIGFGMIEPVVIENTNEINERVQYIIDLIQQLPTADEVDAKLSELEKDETAYEAYYLEISKQVKNTYVMYEDLTHELRLQVTNSNKLMEFEYIWSATTFSNLETVTVNQINVYNNNADPVLIYDGTIGEILNNPSQSFTYWYAIYINKNDEGFYYVDKFIKTQESKLSYVAPENGYILLVHDQYGPVDTFVGDKVKVSADLKTISFGSTAALKNDKDNTDKLTIVDSVSTRDFVELNLYNYGSNINDLYNGNKNYPGFQQDFGTKTPTTLYQSNFGNNITEDYDAGNTNVTVKNGNNINATTEGTYNGKTYGLANLPISGMLKPNLSEDGYPVLSNGIKLDYLFSENKYATKENKQSIDGLFQYDEESGAYTYNSRYNHAQFDPKDDTFKLYEQIISSNYAWYPFGNFLPFNDITKQSMQTSLINREYLLEIRDSAEYKADVGYGDEYSILASSLTTWINLMDNKYGTSWNYEDAVYEYFNQSNKQVAGSEITASDINTLFKNETNLDLWSHLYSIDFDEETNFYFGMEMEMNFLQPKGGMTGKDKNQDGTADYPMEFYFTGDDDVWVYIDDQLFLDLSGIHRHVGGKIDFVNGVVHYYGLDPAIGDVATTPYKTVTFEEILGTNEGLNEKGTFDDYTTHTFKFFYMERGAGSGVCRINFNFPLLKKNSISVQKELTQKDETIEIISNPNFYFQILQENTIISSNKEYKVYDSNNQFVTSRITDADGIFYIKENQRAEFEEIIEENSGEYVVKELLENGTILDDEHQYHITVNGTVITEVNKVDGTLEERFDGSVSSVQDASSGSASFIFNNQIDTNKLATYQLSKIVTQRNTMSDEEFTFVVTLNDDQLLPVGTKYTISGNETEERVVTTAGEISLKDGQTATLNNILASTRINVYEKGLESSSYIAIYRNTDTNEIITQDNSSINKRMKVNETFNIQVENVISNGYLEIPVLKQFDLYDGKERTFNFTLEEVEWVDNDWVTVENGFNSTISSTYTNDNEMNQFTISYVYTDVQENQTIYYKVFEVNENDPQIIYDSNYYIIEVLITKNGTNKSVIPTIINCNLYDKDNHLIQENIEFNQSSILFTNQLTGDLEIIKKLRGKYEDEAPFEFKVQLLDENGKAITGEYQATKFISNGTEELTITFDENGEAIIQLNQNESIIIHKINYQTSWKVDEITSEDFAFDIVYMNGEEVSDQTYSYGKIDTDTNNATIINNARYALPKTGGSGTYIMSIIGSLFILLSIAGFIIQKNKEVQ